MERKRVYWTLSLIVLAALGALALAGQEAGRPGVTMQVAPNIWWSSGDGVVVAPGIAFAGPQDARSVLIESLGRGRLGIQISDVAKDDVEKLKLAGPSGVRVVKVEEDSAAEKAGMRKDDVLVDFDGERVRSASQLQRLVRETPAGRPVTIRVSRAGQMTDLTVELEDRARSRTFRNILPRIRVNPLPGGNIFSFSIRPRLGISAAELTDQLAEYFGVKEGEGVLVREVTAGSAAEKAGLKAGDVIVKVGDTKVGDVSDLRKALADETEENEQVTLTIVRERQVRTLEATLEKPKPPARRHRAGLWCNNETCEEFEGDFDWKFDFDFDVDPDEWNEHIESMKEHLEETMREVETRLHKDLGRNGKLQLHLNLQGEKLREQFEKALRVARLRRI